MLAPHLRQLRRQAPPARVLDYGCGWGSLLLSLGSGFSLAGYDLVGEATSNLARTMRALGRPFEAATVDAHGALSAGDFDLVIASHVLEHVVDDEALLRSLRAALKPGGLLLVNVPINELVPDPKHVRSYDAQQLERKLAGAGFEIVSLAEQDRVSGWLIRHEAEGPLRRRALKGLRGFLALLPWRVIELGEALLLAGYPRQQLLALASAPVSSAEGRG